MNGQTDWQAQRTSHSFWSTAWQEVFRGLRNFLIMDRSEQHRTDRLKERGVEKGSGRHSTLQGREQSVFNGTNIDTVSRAALGRLLQSFQPPYHFIVLPRAFHCIFFHLIVFFIEKNVFAWFLHMHYIQSFNLFQSFTISALC